MSPAASSPARATRIWRKSGGLSTRQRMRLKRDEQDSVHPTFPLQPFNRNHHMKMNFAFASALILLNAATLAAQKPDLVVQRGHDKPVTCLAFSPSGKVLASGSEDQTVLLWDVATGMQLRSLATGGIVRNVAFAADGKTLLTQTEKKAEGPFMDFTLSELQLWEVASGTRCKSPSNNPTYIHAVTAQADDKFLLCSSMDPKGKEITLQVSEFPLQKQLWKDGPKFAKLGPTAFAPRGQFLAMGGSHVRVWDTATAKEAWSWQGDGKTDFQVAIAAQGNYLIGFTKPGMIRRWDLATGKEAGQCQGPKAGIQTLALHPEGKIAATVSPDGLLESWDLETGKILNTISRTA